MLTNEEKELFERESQYEESEGWKEEHREEIEGIVDQRILQWIIGIAVGIVVMAYLVDKF